MTDREIARTIIIEEKLDYISRQFGQLQIVEQIPDGVGSLELVNRAIDVKSSAFVFLAALIRHESRGLGVTGKPPPKLDLNYGKLLLQYSKKTATVSQLI